MINTDTSLRISHIFLKNFRCFNQINVDLDSPIVFLCGPNGTGKTSVLEALYYACYLKSFRTNNARELIAINQDAFFLKLIVHNTSVDQSLEHTINIGFSDNKRLVKIDNQSTVSYKDLLSHYRIISLTEDDLLLVKGSPEYRRSFIDQALLLHNSSFITTMKEFRVILDQRNSLLQNDVFDKESYFVWSHKLWEKTYAIQTMRKQILHDLEREINNMLSAHVDKDLFVTFTYNAKKHSDQSFSSFWNQNASLEKEELYYKRSLFGIHLDDFIISLEGKKSRVFASRGQQKMIALLIKAAQIRYLTLEKEPVIFLLDDFMTDFDHDRGSALLSVLFNLHCQLIITSPHQNNPLEDTLKSLGKDFKKISI